MSLLRVCAVQVDMKWEDVKQNLATYEQMLKDVSGQTDLIIFPEMFSTGFTTKPSRYTVDTSILTVEWMRKMSATLSVAVCGSVIIEEHGKLYNRFYAYLPDGQFFTYDKRHLFRLGEEDAMFTSGSKNISFTYKGFRVRPQICYDLRFPVWNRNKVSDDGTFEYDLLVVVANWPKSRIVQWEKLLMARAIENQAYVCGVNRIGVDGNDIEYNGGTMVINYDGEILKKSPDHQEHMLFAELDLDALHQARQKMPFWKDWDSFQILNI